MRNEIWDFCPECGAIVEGTGAYSHCIKSTIKIDLDDFMESIEKEYGVAFPKKGRKKVSGEKHDKQNI